jgi:hypothetical protein
MGKDELARFSDPWDEIGLDSWRRPGESDLLARLKGTAPMDAPLEPRGLQVLARLWGDRVLALRWLESGYAIERLMVLDWMTGFRVLGFFTEEEIRGFAVLYGPPERSILGQFWYGLLGGESLADIERIFRRRARADARTP